MLSLLNMPKSLTPIVVGTVYPKRRISAIHIAARWDDEEDPPRTVPVVTFFFERVLLNDKGKYVGPGEQLCSIEVHEDELKKVDGYDIIYGKLRDLGHAKMDEREAAIAEAQKALAGR